MIIINRLKSIRNFMLIAVSVDTNFSSSNRFFEFRPCAVHGFIFFRCEIQYYDVFKRIVSILYVWKTASLLRISYHMQRGKKKKKRNKQKKPLNFHTVIPWRLLKKRKKFSPSPLPPRYCNTIIYVPPRFGLLNEYIYIREYRFCSSSVVMVLRRY